VGAHNREVFGGLLELDPVQIDQLMKDGVI
jgi:hypothetical protein